MLDQTRHSDAAEIINASAARESAYSQVHQRVLDAVSADEIARVRSGAAGLIDLLGDKADKYDITKQPKVDAPIFTQEESDNIASNPDANPDLLHTLAMTTQNLSTLFRLSQNPSLKPETVRHLFKLKTPAIVKNVAKNQAATPALLNELLDTIGQRESEQAKALLWIIGVRRDVPVELVSRVVEIIGSDEDNLTGTNYPYHFYVELLGNRADLPLETLQAMVNQRWVKGTFFSLSFSNSPVTKHPNWKAVAA